MTSESDDGKVKRLPVRFKGPIPEERSVVRDFEIVGRGLKCCHLFVPYVVDPAAAEVECGACGEKLNAMWVLGKLAVEDRRLAESQARYQDEQKRLSERQKTKCVHCGKMTRISRR